MKRILTTIMLITILGIISLFLVASFIIIVPLLPLLYIVMTKEDRNLFKEKLKKSKE